MNRDLALTPLSLATPGIWRCRNLTESQHQDEKSIWCAAEVYTGYCLELLWFYDYAHYCEIEIYHQALGHTYI